LLEVRDGEILVGFYGIDVAGDLCSQTSGQWEDATYGALMFAEGGVYDAAVEVDFGGVGDDLKGGEGIVEFTVIVVTEGLDPGFDFLASERRQGRATRSRTCFRDMLRQEDQRPGSGERKASVWAPAHLTSRAKIQTRGRRREKMVVLGRPEGTGGRRRYIASEPDPGGREGLSGSGEVGPG